MLTLEASKIKLQVPPSKYCSQEEKHTGNYKALMVSLVMQGVRGSHKDPGTLPWRWERIWKVCSL